MLKRTSRLFLILSFSVSIFLFSCSEKEAKELFKSTLVPSADNSVRVLTDSNGEVVVSDTIKSSFTQKYIYNKYNSSQVDAIEGEQYVSVENGRQVLIKTLLELDVYENPEFMRLLSSDSAELGIYEVTQYNGKIYPTDSFRSSLPVKAYKYDREDLVSFFNSKASGTYTKLPSTSLINLVYSENLDSLFVFPKKVIEDSTGTREVGFTKIKNGDISQYLPYIDYRARSEMIIYDKIPDFARKDFFDLIISQYEKDQR